MTINPTLREPMESFREMVRARGPEECLRVAAMSPFVRLNENDLIAQSRVRHRMTRLAARAALRWWRWQCRRRRRPLSSTTACGKNGLFLGPLTTDD